MRDRLWALAVQYEFRGSGRDSASLRTPWTVMIALLLSSKRTKLAARVLISVPDADTDTDTGAEMQIQMEIQIQIEIQILI